MHHSVGQCVCAMTAAGVSAPCVTGSRLAVWTGLA
eukprot:COSAG01_NODE_3097_length_6590_cov_20.121707_1_plen_34_part_10